MFLVMVPAVHCAAVSLYRSIAKVYAIVWLGSGRGVRITRRGVGVFLAALALQLMAVEVIGWIRRADQLGGLAALLVYLVFVGGAWLASPRSFLIATFGGRRSSPGRYSWVPGSCSSTSSTSMSRPAWSRIVPNTYGALGIAAALLFSLVLVGRLIVVSAELNAALAARRALRRNGA